MAKDLIDIKRSEFALLIPRHILHEDDELFVIRNPQTNLKPQRIPPRLMIVPRDANYLVEVFFEVFLKTNKIASGGRRACFLYCVSPDI